MVARVGWKPHLIRRPQEFAYSGDLAAFRVISAVDGAKLNMAYYRAVGR